MNLIYDDNGRRSASGLISGGLIWLDRYYSSSEVGVAASLGTGENARLFADLMTQSDGWIIILGPGYTIDSWDSAWRLPHSGSNPTMHPEDSEMLHLVVSELGNEWGHPLYEQGIFTHMLASSPNNKGAGFYPYWLDQDAGSAQGTDIWYNTSSGNQETVPAGFRGGFVMFVRSATVSYDPQAAGVVDAAEPMGLLEGFVVSVGSSEDLDAFGEPYSYIPADGRSLVGIVGMGIAGSDDHVYAWYSDGTVSSGTSSDLDFYRTPYSYSLPQGKTPADIVGIGIAGSNDYVYVWYRLSIK
jgi:hypothetical protein